MSKSFIEIVGSLADHMEELFAGQPQIQSPQEVINNMTPGMRQKLSFALGPVFQAKMADLTAQELEAVGKLREVFLRMAIFYNEFLLSSELTVNRLEIALKTIYELQETSREWDEKLEGPWENVGRLFQAQSAREELGNFMKSQGSTNPEVEQAMALLMPSIPEDLKQAAPAEAVATDSNESPDMPEWVDEVFTGEIVEDEKPPRRRPGSGFSPSGNGHRASRAKERG